MRTPHARPLLASAAIALCLGLASPASAAIRHTDAEINPHRPAYLDLTGLKVRNGPHLVVIDMSLRALHPNQTSAYAYLFLPDTGGYYLVGTHANGHGHHRVFIERLREDEHIDCRGLGVVLDTRHDMIQLVIPHHCLPDLPDPVSVSAATQQPQDGAIADETRTLVVPRG